MQLQRDGGREHGMDKSKFVIQESTFMTYLEWRSKNCSETNSSGSWKNKSFVLWDNLFLRPKLKKKKVLIDSSNRFSWEGRITAKTQINSNLFGT